METRWTIGQEGESKIEGRNGTLSYELDVRKVVQYLREREKEEGGFSFVPELYPDIEETYYAIRALQLLNDDVDREKTLNYLKNIDWKQVRFPRAVHMSLYLHLSLNIELPLPLIDLIKKDWSRFPALDAQYYSDEIQKLLNEPLKRVPSQSPFQFHGKDNLQSLRKKVSVLLNHEIKLEKQEIVRWVQLCQNGDGGFGFYPGTTSYMENTYCALEILSKLNSSPREINVCREYILNCQTKSGGFGRAPISFPFIESTFHAVAGLFMLEKMERGDT